MSVWGKWTHKASEAVAGGWKVGETRNMFGCSRKATSTKSSNGIRFVGFKWTGCTGLYDAVNISGDGRPNKKPYTAHPYIAHIGGGNVKSPIERGRRDSGKTVCFEEQNKVVIAKFGELIRRSKQDPIVSLACGSGRADPNVPNTLGSGQERDKYLPGDEKRTNCLTSAVAKARAYKNIIGYENRMDEYNQTDSSGVKKGDACRKKLADNGLDPYNGYPKFIESWSKPENGLKKCKQLMDGSIRASDGKWSNPCKPATDRACDTNHAAGRAWDAFPAPTGFMYHWPDPYYPDNWKNCKFVTWMFWAENAHNVDINNITNEYWHWQFNNPIESLAQSKKLLAEIPKTETPPETTSTENQTTTTVEENKTDNNQVVNDEPNLSFVTDEESEPSYEEEYQYSSLEGVSSQFPPLELDRFFIGGLKGLKYYSDDPDLLTIDRFRNAESTKTPSEQQSQFGSNENNESELEENLRDNSRWNGAPSVDETDKIKSVANSLEKLRNEKETLRNKYEETEKTYIEFRAIVDRLDPTDDSYESYPSDLLEKIQVIGRNNSGSELSTTIERVVSGGKVPSRDIISKFEEQLYNNSTEISKVEEKISSAEKELQLLRKDSEDSRDSLETRFSNWINPITSGKALGLPESGSITDGLSSVIGSGSLSKIKEFDLYETGDKVEKLATKVKQLKIPKGSDLQTILAGGLSSKNLLSSLSSFSLPGMEELDSLKEIASQAEALYNGDLDILKQYAGDLGALDAVNNLQFLKDAKSTLGPIIEEGKSLYESGSKIYADGQKYYKSASKAYDDYQKIKKQSEDAWKEGGRLWNQTKGEWENLKKESAQLWETIKDLPEQAKGAAIAKWNELSSSASNKWDELQKKGQDQIDRAKSEYTSLKNESDKLLSEGKKILDDPKIAESKNAEAKVKQAEEEVNNLKETLPEEAIKTLESAVEKKKLYENSLTKAVMTEKAILASKDKVNIDKEPKRHFPKEFKSFTDWVLEKDNEVRNIEYTPQLLQDIQYGSITELEVQIDKSPLPNEPSTVSVKIPGDPSLTPENPDIVSVDLSGNISVSQQNINSISKELSDSLSLSPSGQTSNQSIFPPFIIYRGATGKIPNPTFAQLESGKYTNFGYERIPTQFKSYFDFGKSESNPVNLKKLFHGYLDSILSPVDIALLLNPGNVGMFNNIAPYGFGEGSELAAAVTFQKVVQKDVGSLFSKGGVGTRKEPNWAYNPEWAGLYVNFLLEENGVYQSDEDFLDFKRLKKVEDYVKRGEGLKLKNTAPLTEIPKSFPGAVICYFDRATRKGHAEVILRTTLGGFITLGGNIRLGDISKFGSTHGFRFYYSIKEFSPSNDVYIIKRGTKNNWTTNGRLDGRIKRTVALNEYMSSVENRDSPKNSKLFAEAYNILRGNISDSVYTRADEMKLTDNGKVSIKDESFTIHKYNDIYLSGSIQLERIQTIDINNPAIFSQQGH